MRYDFEVVRLWRVDPAPILAGGLSGLLPIVPLMRGATPDQLPHLAEQVLSGLAQVMKQQGVKGGGEQENKERAA